jgi:subtilisin family serine protease
MLTLVLLILPDTGVSAAGSGPAMPARGTLPLPDPDQAYAPGQVLVRFKAGISRRTAASLVARHDARLLQRIADHTFTLAVPVGQEEEMVRTIASNPAVQYTSLNYRITEPPIDPLEPVADTAASEVLTTPAQEPESCITDLWMSTTQQGERLLENMVPSGTAQVYVFFEYTACELEAIRVQVFYLGRGTKPEPVFDETGTIISGSGIQGIKVQAWPHFEKGTFPVGKYLTSISLSPEGGWDEVKNVFWRVSTFPNDEWFQGRSNFQWPLHSTGNLAVPEADINMPQAWDITTGSPDVTIAIVSTGVWIDHPDLKNKIWTNRGETPGNGIDDDENGCVDDIHGCEFYNGEVNPNPTDVPGGWGTFTSGIAAAETNNRTGMAGVSWGARIMPIKVLRLRPDGSLGGYLADMITGIEYAVANGARIIHLGPRVEENNVSREQLELLRSVIDDAVSQGVLVVAGIGDVHEDHLLYPARFDNVVAVGCSDLRNERCWFSNYGPGIDLVAPGELVLSTYFSDQFQYIRRGGTNLAAAHVEGVASLIWSVNPDLSPAEVRAILRDSADDLGPRGYDEEYGYGKLDAAAAVELTPHHLSLRTADLDRLSLVFLLDNRINRACQTVWNRGTSPQTWTLDSNSNWLTVQSPGDLSSAPVPSDIQVCVDAGQFAGPGTFEATLQASSTLTRHEDPIHIDVTAIYQPRLSRVRLGFIRRP